MPLLDVKGLFRDQLLERSILGLRVPDKKSANFPRRLYYPKNYQYGDKVLLFLPAECMVCFMVISYPFPTRIILWNLIDITGMCWRNLIQNGHYISILVHTAPAVNIR
jgi:hypothetical protein